MERGHRLFACALLGLAWSACADGGAGTGTDGGRRDAGLVDSGHRDGSDEIGSDSGADRDGGTPRSVTIYQIQDPDHPEHIPAGNAVRIEGAIVAAVDTFEERGPGMGIVGDVWIADPRGGPYSGLQLYMPTQLPCPGRTALGLGDRVDVEGTIREFAVPTDGSGRTVTQLIGATVTCTRVGDGLGPAPERIRDPATLTVDATAEPWEGVLVELSMVEASGDPDRFGTFTLRSGPPVDDDLYRHPASFRDTFLRLRGIFHYMFGRWALYPRSSSDIELGEPRRIEWEMGLWGCADGADGDADGASDCADADCAASRFCRGPTVRVQDVQDPASAMHPRPDSDLTLAGPLVVTAIDTFEEMPGTGYVGTVVVQDAEAGDPRFSGIHVFMPTIEGCGGGPLALGDRVYVAGRYREYADPTDSGGTLTEIASGIVSCRSPGTPIAPTLIATPSDLSAAATAEPWEGVLVEIRDVSVTMAPGMFGRFVVTGMVNVDDDFYRAIVSVGDRIRRLAGVLTYQFGYQLEPRSSADVELAPTERDDATCGNGADDDGDGAVDCSDLDCCRTAPCAGAVSSRRLILSEVLYDAVGADDGREWIEIRNAGTSPVPLACYAVGNGTTSYRYSLAQLPPIVVPPDGCVVIGGPIDCGGASCVELDFEPDLHNGPSSGPGAAGVAILYGLTSTITDATIPVDAVIYGNANTGGLRDARGTTPPPHVIDVAPGHSIARGADGAWLDQARPNAGTCTTYTPP
jgi:hypothetical protein